MVLLSILIFFDELIYFWKIYVCISSLFCYHPLWNTLSGNICSELQSNYTITKSFIIRLLKLNVEKNGFSFIQSYQFHSSLLSDGRNMAGQSQRLFRMSKSVIDRFLKKKRELRAVFSLRVQD